MKVHLLKIQKKYIFSPTLSYLIPIIERTFVLFFMRMIYFRIVKLNCTLSIMRLQKTGLSTSHQLSRCQVVLTRSIFSFSFLRNWIMSQFEFLSFITIGFLKFCHNLSFVTNRWLELSQFHFYNFFLLFELLSFVAF